MFRPNQDYRSFRLPEVFVLEEKKMLRDLADLQIALTEAMQSLVAMRNREGTT